METTIKKMEQILNEDKEIQLVMKILAGKAKERNFSASEWEEAKQRMFISMFYQIMERDEEVRKEFASNLYDYLRK